MNKLFTKIVGAALGLTMAIGLGVAVGSNSEAVPVHATDPSITATWANFGISGTAAQKTESTTGYSIMISSVSTQGVVKSGTINNQTAIPGSITSVTVNGAKTGSTKTDGTFTVYGGTSSDSITNSMGQVTGLSSTAQNKTVNFSGNYTFFKIAVGSARTLIFTSLVITYSEGSNDYVGSLSVSPSTWIGYDSQTLSVSSFTVSGSKNGTAGAVTSSDYEYKGIGYMSGDNFVARDASFSSGNPTTADTRLAWKAKYPTTAGGSTYAWAYVTLTVSADGVNSIAISGSMTKTTYNQGDAWDPAGFTVKAYYASAPSTPVDVTSNANLSWTYSPATTDSTSTTSVTCTASFGGKSATSSAQSVTVKEVTVTKYELITDASDLVAGCDYLIGNAAQTYFMSTTQNGNNRGRHQLAGSVSSNKVSYETGMEVVTLGGSSGAWTLYANNSDTAGYLYLPSNNNYLRTRASSFGWGISFSSGTPSISATVTSTRYIKHNSGSSIFSCYTNGQEDISLWKEVSTTQSIAISKDSVSGLKGDSDDTVSITASNFTPTDIEVAYSTSGVATVTKGTISDGIIPLNVSYTGVGETTATITVKGGTADYSADLAISVAAKPQTGTMVAKLNSVVVSSAVECITDSYVAFTFEAEDTDGNAYAVAAADLKLTITSGSSYGSARGTTGINGTAEGTVVARFALKVLEKVYVDVTVNVVDDYIETVGTPTFAPGLTDTQGQSPDVSVFTSRPGTMHSGSSTTIPFENYKFSYDQTYASAQYGSVFTYDFSHGTTVDSTHKSQTIYVFCDIDEAAHGSYTVTVEQLDDPLTAITFTNVTDNAVDVTRGNSFQLEWAYTPTNPTDGKEVEFIINDNSDGIDITVSELGLISIGASSDLGDALVIIQSTHDDSIQDYVVVSAVLGTMKYTVSEAESWTKVTNDSTLTAGDVIIVASDTKGKVLGDFTGSNKYANEGTATFSDGSASDVTGALEFKLETGSSSGTWKLKNGTKYLYGTSSKTTLCLSDTASDVTITISSGNATIDFGSSCRILHNVGSSRFSNYTSATSSTMLLPQIYLKSGGDVEMDVTETLFNGVHNNFGTGKTYEWDEDCVSFNTSNWASAGSALTGISGYANYKLNRAVADASGNEIEQFLAKYDFIIGKFGTAYDFLGRFQPDGINHGAARVTPNSILGDNVNTVAIIVVISVISASAIGGYFFLRKRKED